MPGWAARIPAYNETMSDLRHDPVAPPASDRAQALGFGPMDRVHGELDVLLQRAATCAEAELPGLLAEVDAHLREHFALEDGWMRETQFPPRDCHIDEHAAVLKSSGEVLALTGRAFAAGVAVSVAAALIIVAIVTLVP